VCRHRADLGIRSKRFPTKIKVQQEIKQGWHGLQQAVFDSDSDTDRAKHHERQSAGSNPAHPRFAKSKEQTNRGAQLQSTDEGAEGFSPVANKLTLEMVRPKTCRSVSEERKGGKQDEREIQDFEVSRSPDVGIPSILDRRPELKEKNESRQHSVKDDSAANERYFD
jgi:hypothetical protein